MSRATVKAVDYRFTREMLETYRQLLLSALKKKQSLVIYASVEAREKIAKTFPAVFKTEEIDQVIILAYPTSQSAAINTGRGVSNRTTLFIDERGKYTDLIKQAAAPVKGGKVLIVYNKHDVKR